MKKRLKAICTLILIVLFITGCAQKQATVTDSVKKPKNVIMIVGDGMGPEQVGMLLTYSRQAPNRVLSETAFDRLMADGGGMGLMMTNAHNVLVVDSAAAGSQMATGKFAGSEMVGLDYNGDKAETVLERAKASGKSTGLISDTRVTHATPAAYAAHQPRRKMENEIAVDMLTLGPDVMMGGGLRHWIPKSANDKASAVRKELGEMTEGSVRIKSKRKDDKNLLAEAKNKGYSLAFNKNQMDASQGKLLGLFSYSAMPDAIRVSNSLEDPSRNMPTLKEMSAKAIDILSKNEDGFS